MRLFLKPMQLENPRFCVLHCFFEMSFHNGYLSNIDILKTYSSVKYYTFLKNGLEFGIALIS